MGFQLVIGNGPAGAATARLLAGQGSPVRVVSRSSRPDQPGIDHVALDAADSGRLIEAAEGATVGAVAVQRLPPGMLRVLALVSPLLRELKEVQYQFDRPFVVDSSAYTARFDEDATPIDEQIRATVDWWRQRRAIVRRTRGERSARNSA